MSTCSVRPGDSAMRCKPRTPLPALLAAAASQGLALPTAPPSESYWFLRAVAAPPTAHLTEGIRPPYALCHTYDATVGRSLRLELSEA